MVNLRLLENLFALDGRSAIVTGGSAGIGRMIASALSGAGAEVWIVARNEQRAEQVAAEISPDGRCRVIVADLADGGSPQKIASEFAATGRKLDILVNNAGITSLAPLGKVTSDHWDHVMDLNAKAPFMLIQALVPLMARDMAERRGQIINIGSCGGISIDTRTSYAYFASKAALHHLTRILAKELVERGICVNAIAPGYFHTDLIDSFADNPKALAGILELVPARRFGQFEDVAGASLMFATNSFITGVILPLDGGYLVAHP